MNTKGINSRLLKSKMALRGYDQKALAKNLGVTQQTVSNLVNGSNSPSYELLNKIYIELQLTPEEAAQIFFGYEKTEV